MLDQWEEDRLRQRVQEDLVDIIDVQQRLKDAYIELAGLDRRLAGTVSFSDLSFAFGRCKVMLSDFISCMAELQCVLD